MAAFYSAVSPSAVQRVRWPRGMAGKGIAESPGYRRRRDHHQGFFRRSGDGPRKKAGDFPPRFELRNPEASRR
jgi:hypothetical protein